MKKVTILAGVAVMTMLSGCSSVAGPFVTNISSNGQGGLIVEKCMVNLNRAINTVEASDCTNTPIQVTVPTTTK